jgi:geranylgeranyl reductase family protein
MGTTPEESMIKRSYDVIIVGAGPSGAECARALAGSGAKVLVLDKKRSGWHKPCGGGVSEMALVTYEIPRSPWFETEGVRIFDAAGASSVAPLRFYDVRRNQFDELLSADAAARGAEVRLETTVQKLARTGDGFEVETADGTCEAPYLVGADGFSSTVRERLFGEKLDMKAAAIALEYWFERGHGVRHLDFYVEPELLPLGYSYAFPKDPGTITIGIAGLEIAEPREVLERMLELPRYRALTGGERHVAVHGARIPYRPLSRLREGRLVLVGDAAGLNTPIAFAGIPIALASGRMAGRLLAEAIKSGSDAPLDGYTVDAIAGVSFAFRGCHVYWRHLVHRGSLPSFEEFIARASRDPGDHMMLYATWDMLQKLSGSLDLKRLARYAEAGTIALS